MATDEYAASTQETIVKAARICGHVGQTVVIYKRTDGSLFCNFQENQGCNEKTEICRLRQARDEQAG